MKKTLKLLKQDFESSCHKTKQFNSFFRAFKSEFSKIIKPYTTEIKLYENHFYISGFFQLCTDHIYYINLGDVRWFKTFFIRTATSFKDYTGGANHDIKLDDSFETNLKNYLKVA